MPFWKKSEDPWDVDPNRNRNTSEAEETGPGLLDSLREDWDALQAQRQEKREKLRLPPEKCPWCGKEMEQGFLMGGRGVFWYRGIPTGKALWFSPGNENIMRVDTKGFFSSYHVAWYCPDCKKMTIDAADLQTEAEKNDLFPQRAAEVPEDRETTGEGE